MEVSRVRALRGPNRWSRNTAIEAIVSCSKSECTPETLAGLATGLRSRFPEIDILEPLGNDWARAIVDTLGRTALSLQAQAGSPVTFCRISPTSDPDVYQLIVEYREEAVGRLSLSLAEQLCMAAWRDAPFDLAAALVRLRELNDDVSLGPSTAAIVQAAQNRGIPCRRLTQGSLVQFGWGSRQRRIQAAETDASSAIAESIAQDKELTKMLLRAAGVPVPDGRCVTCADDAWNAAVEIGAAVVVKPRDGNQGKGVGVNLQGREQISAAYASAAVYGPDVIVERYFPGHDFRLLVVGDKLVAAARRDPPQVIGDGRTTILQLVEQINADPQRGDGHATSLTKIRMDDIALAVLTAQGYEVGSVPGKGALVLLRNNANLSTGGTATDVTDHVHPEIAAVAVAAAQMVGLDICGIDMVSPSVFDPLDAQAACIVEVNAAPGLRMHLTPSFGTGRPVGEAIISSIFREGEDARIPVVAVAGTNGKTTTVRLIAHLLAQSGRCVGMANSDGVYIGAEAIDTGDCSGPRSARNVLLHPDVDAAVLEAARGGVLREGLGFDRCHVAVVTNIGLGDHLGLDYISTVEELAAVKRVIVENVAPDGTAVLNAADTAVVAMAASCPGSVTYFARDRDQPVLATHRAQGGRAVYVDGGNVVLNEGGFERRYALSGIPLTRNGTVAFQVENVLAAIAAVWALDLDEAQVRVGLASFASDAATTPGRFNVFDYRGATLIADYGHNPDAIDALVQAVGAMPAKRRSVVISGAGDRRDEDIRRQTMLLGNVFDEVILYEDMCQRGRADGEVLALLRQGLANAGRARCVQEIRGEFLAIDAALKNLQSDDLCLILVDQVQRALEHISLRISQD